MGNLAGSKKPIIMLSYLGCHFMPGICTSICKPAHILLVIVKTKKYTCTLFLYAAVLMLLPYLPSTIWSEMSLGNAVTLSYIMKRSILKYTTRIKLVCLMFTSPTLFQVLLLIPGVLNFSFTDTELNLMSQLAVFVGQVQSSY